MSEPRMEQMARRDALLKEMRENVPPCEGCSGNGWATPHPDPLRDGCPQTRMIGVGPHRRAECACNVQCEVCGGVATYGLYGAIDYLLMQREQAHRRGYLAALADVERRIAAYVKTAQDAHIGTDSHEMDRKSAFSNRIIGATRVNEMIASLRAKEAGDAE